jgi:hypothetical protein
MSFECALIQMINYHLYKEGAAQKASLEVIHLTDAQGIAECGPLICCYNGVAFPLADVSMDAAYEIYELSTQQTGRRNRECTHYASSQPYSPGQSRQPV